MRQKKKSRSRLYLIPILVLAGVAPLWVGLSQGDPPTLAVASGWDPADGGQLDLLGPANDLMITAAEPSLGIGTLRAELVQGDRTWLLAEASHTPRPGWKIWESPTHPRVDLPVVVSRDAQPELQQGAATVRVTAGRAAGFLRSPEPVVFERGFEVTFTPPTLAVNSSQHYVAQGGSEVILYTVGGTEARSGVQAGDWFFPGYRLPDGEPNQRFALFAVPYLIGDVNQVKVIAEDQVGNRAERSFVDRFFQRPPRTDTIRLSDSFMERVVPEIIERTPELRAEGTLLEQYLKINGDLRRTNRAELKELAARSDDQFLWRGPFLPLRNAKAMAGFAERRTYTYNGEPVDQQDHLGFDLASTKQAPVLSANRGVVLKADWFGIYGNTVVVDHGYGLLSLYGHLSEINVQPGDEVQKGQELGRTGVTGLAGGDHLHFAVLLHGLPVNAREWWDDHWIEDRLRLKLVHALPG